jgi:hypothetical protein
VSHYGIAVVRMTVRGRGREVVTVREAVAAVVQMDVDSGVGGRERMERVKTIENELCKMMLKSLRVVRPCLRCSVMRPDREWACHERDRYRRI